MKNKTNLLFVAFLVVALAACSGTQPTQAVQGGNQASQPNSGAVAGTPSAASLDSKLAAGTLKLEGTSLAVTAAEAKQLLPLWQQLQSLNTNGTPSASDTQAIYQQIESDMTADQIQAIQQMSLTQSDLQSLMQAEGIQATPGSGFNGGSFPTLSAEQRATRAAQFQGQTPGSGGGRGGGGFGTPGPGRGGFRGTSFIFVNSVIKLLQQRAGA